jgi:rod shape-determining protein MreC
MNRAHVKVNEPPVFFRRGPSAVAKLVFFSLLSIITMVIDYRLDYLAGVRQAVSTALYPIEQAMVSPVRAFQSVADYFSNQDQLLAENAELKRRLAEQAGEAQRAQAIDAEYSHLRTLAAAPNRLNTTGIVAEVVHIGRNPFRRKILINRGSNNDVRPGLPVIDGAGVVGQVTAVTPFSAEVTLLTDKDQAIPVMVVRNGLRAVAFGAGQGGALSIPFLATNAEIQKDDLLVTSGIDGTYPPGLSVATVTEVDHRAALAFSRVVATPTAGVENHRYLMVLTTPPGENYPKAQTPEESLKTTKEMTPSGRAKTGGTR